jgi:carbamoyl-phosphate synthase large subunit
VLEAAGLPAPRYGLATSYDEAKAIAERVGYPVLVRPSYVLGGRGMEIVYSDDMLVDYVSRSTHIGPDAPVLVDRFLEDAVEVDVDALYDGTDLYLAGVMEHIEEAGIHSGDSACALPPITLGRADLAKIRSSTLGIAAGVGVRGLLNVQYAVKDDVLYVLEANPGPAAPCPSSARRRGAGGQGGRADHARDDDRRPARRGDAAGRRRRRRPAVRRADLGQGGGAALRPLPHGRR